jgi:uracil-DNA glycosylase
LKNGTDTRQLDKIAEAVRACQSCVLASCRTKAVPGEGNPFARIMIIGEAPGRQEDESGSPFVGMAGKFLDKLLATAGLTRSEVFITNVVKCRPPENRKPERDEVAACADFLTAQIAAINPRLIICLGGTAASAVLGMKTISQDHGKLIERDGRYYFVAYHPAARFHRQKIVDDFEKLAVELKRVDLS